jgi:hypothetical protein
MGTQAFLRSSERLVHLTSVPLHLSTTAEFGERFIRKKSIVSFVLMFCVFFFFESESLWPKVASNS